MTALAHVRAVVTISTPPLGFRGACQCGWTATERRGAMAVAERDADEHVVEATRCRRRVWRSRDAAEAAKVDHRQRRHETEFCDSCKGWHLTSQPQRVNAL